MESGVILDGPPQTENLPQKKKLMHTVDFSQNGFQGKFIFHKNFFYDF